MKLNSKYIERNIKQGKVFSYDCVDSTNVIAKGLAVNGCSEGTVVCALKQMAGKGRLGRTFVSKKGGVYFSVVLRPKENADNTLFITVAAAVAAARAIEDASGKKCDIKWVNDVYISGKKVCGILTEGGFSDTGALDYAILGVGINLYEPKGGFASDLPLAGSVFNKKALSFFKSRAKAKIVIGFINHFFKFYRNLEQKQFIDEYKERSFLTGKTISFIKNGEELSGSVVGIDDDARLVVSVDEKIEVLSHGEIQIVGMEQLAI